MPRPAPRKRAAPPGAAVFGFGAAGPLPPDPATMRLIAHADERTRLQVAITNGPPWYYQQHRQAPVYRLWKVWDDFTAVFQRVDEDIDPSDPDHDITRDYTEHLARKDLVIRIPPEHPWWAKWLAYYKLRRHAFFLNGSSTKTAE